MAFELSLSEDRGFPPQNKPVDTSAAEENTLVRRHRSWDLARNGTLPGGGGGGGGGRL